LAPGPGDPRDHADGTSGGKIDAATTRARAVRQLVQRVRLLRRLAPIRADRRTRPLTLQGIPTPLSTADAPFRAQDQGIAASKLCWHRSRAGWTGVSSPPGRSATGAAPASKRRIQDYKLSDLCPALSRRRHKPQCGSQLVELRHPVHHLRQDELRQVPEPGRPRSSLADGETPNGELASAYAAARLITASCCPGSFRRPGHCHFRGRAHG